MKIEFNEDDLSYIQRVNEDLENGKRPPLFINQIGDTYTFEFKCTDIARANLFAFMMMASHLEEAKEFQKLFGIDVQCINYAKGDSKLNTLKSYLKNFLEELEQM